MLCSIVTKRDGWLMLTNGKKIKRHFDEGEISPGKQ